MTTGSNLLKGALGQDFQDNQVSKKIRKTQMTQALIFGL